MPQSDAVDQFKALSPDRQRTLLGKMTPEQKTKLQKAIQSRLSQKQAKTSIPQESTLTKVGRGAAIGAFEGLGIKPSTSGTEVVKGSIEQLGKGVGNLVKDTWERNKSTPDIPGFAHGMPAVAATAVDIVPTMIDQMATSLESGIRKTAKAYEDKDYESAAEYAASTLVQAALLKSAKEAPDVAAGESEIVSGLKRAQEQGLPEAVTRDATQKAIQKVMHDRALSVQDHLSSVEAKVDAERTEAWQTIEKKVDDKFPDGAIDLSKIGRETEEAVAEKIKTPQKMPQTVGDVRKKVEPPRVFGSRLDPSNPAHAALIERLKESGAIPETEQASFGQARQLRSKLGRELQSGTLSGESKSVGWKLYGDLTEAMRKAAEDSGMPGAFEDANRMHAKWMEDWGPDSILGKALKGKNAGDVLGDLSNPRHAEQMRRIMDQYKDYGLDTEAVRREAKLYQKLGSGLPYQMDFSRWEAMSYALGTAAGRPWVGPAYTASREMFNLTQRIKALRNAQRVQAIRSAAEKLGPKASVNEIIDEAAASQ